MNRKNNSTWTDELRSALENAELKPSEGSWERLQADLGRRRGAAWFPYAGLAAALAAVALGVFLFRPGTRLPQEEITVVSNSGVLAQAPAVSEQVPDASRPQPEVAEGKPKVTEGQPEIAKRKPKVAEKQPEASGRQPSAIVPKAESPDDNAIAAKDDDFTPAPPQTLEQEDESAPVVETRPVEEEAPAQIHPVTLQRNRERRKVRISLAGGGLGGRQDIPDSPVASSDYYNFTTLMTKSGGDVLAVAQPKNVMDISELIEHQVPVKLGVNLDIPVGRRSYIGSGLEYSYLRSSVAGERQTLHWLGVPLNFKYRIVQKQSWALGAGAGATVEKCLNASLLGHDYKESAQFSAKVFADLRIALTPMLSLYACPELSYYFTETQLPIYRSGKPLAFGVAAGLAIDL